MSTSKFYPKWVDISMATLVANGAMEKCGKQDGKDVFKMCEMGLKEQKRILDDVHPQYL
jgi:hypothetical protein